MDLQNVFYLYVFACNARRLVVSLISTINQGRETKRTESRYIYNCNVIGIERDEVIFMFREGQKVKLVIFQSLYYSSSLFARYRKIVSLAWPIQTNVTDNAVKFTNHDWPRDREDFCSWERLLSRICEDLN